MAFTIPNVGDASHVDQAEPDAVDFAILLDGIEGDGVISGCAVTAKATPDMTVAVASGTVRLGGSNSSVTAGNLTIGAASATNPRFDLIAVNSSGTKSVVAGSAAGNPVFPQIPASSIIIAAVYVPANDTAINSTQITDKRVTVATGADHGSLTGLTDDDHTQYVLDTDIQALEFLVGTATGYLSGEIVAGTAPGGELGGTCGTPTVDTTHAGSSHAGVVTTHEAASDPHTGYRLESADHDHSATGAQAGKISRYTSRVVRAVSNAAQTINSGTVTAVTLGAEDFDTDTLHSTVSNTSRLTATIAGYYMVTGGIVWDIQTLGTVTFLLTRLSKNGTVIDGSRSYFPPISSFSTNGQGQNVSSIVQLAATDYVEMEVFHDKTAAGTLTIGTTAPSSLQMVYIGE